MSNEAVGPIVVRGIRDNRTYIITHPELEGTVRSLYQQLLEDFEFFTTR